MFELHTFDNQEAQAEALAHTVAGALDAALGAASASADDARVTLALSGGESPRRFLQHLGAAPLAWNRIDVTLADDRWVPENDAASNARLLRETLLVGRARDACLLPLVDVSQPPEQVVAELNRAARPALPAVAVLGMGEDGHTASLFADAPEWPQAIETDQRFVLVHPLQAPHARITWSLAALKRIERLFLLIAGASKLEVLRRAAAAPLPMGISKLAHDKETKLDVYWAAQ